MSINELSSHQCLAHPELFPVLTLLIVTGRVGSRIKRGQTHRVMANSSITFPKKFRLIARDQIGASGCPYLNYTECLLSRSPGTPGMILPHQVLQSFDLPHFEVLPHALRIQFWMTFARDLQVRRGTRSSPCHTADYNPALGCHRHTLLEGIDQSWCQGECH